MSLSYFLFKIVLGCNKNKNLLFKTLLSLFQPIHKLTSKTKVLQPGVNLIKKILWRRSNLQMHTKHKNNPLTQTNNVQI